MVAGPAPRLGHEAAGAAQGTPPAARLPAWARDWLTHALAVRVPASLLPQYAINLVNPPADGSEPDYDGVAELWFDREEDLLAAYATDAGKAVADDSLAVVSKRDRLLTTEYIYEP